ncbi:DUF7521 family protein [Halomicrobium urmianum]|uniref:DUF7521 family protein n=1 Tax=Halomicrobium urmianum TaxID=1586233 RepID=UPI001CD9AD16|nr:oxidoreductase [Halomicrobium urmianum]
MIPNVTATVLVIVVVISTVLVGGCIAYLAHRAARRSESSPMYLFSYGFGVLTVGVALSGLLVVLFRLDAKEGLLIHGVFVLVGFGLLLRSLYMRVPRTHA